MPDAIASPRGSSHVRLTVTDIRRSKAFYELLFGMPPGRDFSDQIDDPDHTHDDSWRTYGGCSFTSGRQTLGLRPVGRPGYRFDAGRVGSGSREPAGSIRVTLMPKSATSWARA